MLKNILASFTKEDDLTTAPKISRQHSRRSGDKCVSMIDGKMYPIENWSEGGVLITADDRLFALGQDVTLDLKFKLRDDMISIHQIGEIVRKNDNKIAVKFHELDKTSLNAFQQVIDDFLTRNFVNSQIEDQI